jgi:hypothetical protein
MRKVLAKVTKGNTDMLAAAIFAQPTGRLVRGQVPDTITAGTA